MLLSHFVMQSFLIIHEISHKVVYHLLFIFLFHIATILTCFMMPCDMRFPTFILTSMYLTFSQLLFCFSKYVKFVPFIIFFLALFKLCFLLFSKSLYPLWYSFASSLWLSPYSLCLSFLFVLSYHCLIFSSFNGLWYFCIIWEFFLPQRFTPSVLCIWKPSRFKSACLLLWQG